VPGIPQEQPWRRWLFLRRILFRRWRRVRATRAGDVPSRLCPVRQGHPGALPAERRQARVLLGLLLFSEIVERRRILERPRRTQQPLVVGKAVLIRRDFEGWPDGHPFCASRLFAHRLSKGTREGDFNSWYRRNAVRWAWLVGWGRRGYSPGTQPQRGVPCQPRPAALAASPVNASPEGAA
jgi:hypothetical protein